MKIHDWLIQARVAYDEVKAATERAFRVEEHSANYSDLTQLEDRVLLSATPVAVVAAPEGDVAQDDLAKTQSESETEQAITDQTAVITEQPRTIEESLALLDETSELLNTTLDDPHTVRQELVILDPGVQNSDELRELLLAQQEDGRELEFFYLDAHRDGVTQIADILADYQDLDAVHVLSHGTAEGLQLGSTWLDAQTIDDYSEVIRGWQGALDSEADLLLYGCDLAASDAGRSLVDQLGNLTATDVAASTDLTGYALFGGDWQLEYQTGHLETRVVVSEQTQADWQGLMAVSLNSTSSAITSSASTSLTWSHTINSGNDRVLTVSLSFDGNKTSTGVTYGGTALTLVGRHVSVKHTIEIWQLTAPTVGAANIVATFSGSTHANGGGAAFNGVDQTTPAGTLQAAAGVGGTPASITISSAADEMVIDTVITDNASSLTVGANQTQQWLNHNAGMDRVSASSTETGAASVTMSWNGPADDWTIGAVALKAAPTNTAPTLDDTASPVLNSTDEDSGAPSGAVGTLISSLVDFAGGGGLDNVSDPDSSPVTGIAVTAADTTNGSWWYTTNGGTNWNALGSPNDSAARLLAADANTRIYFEPNADYNGTIANAITFHAWDQNSGSNGGMVDLTATTTETVRDNFSSTSFGNNDGTESWTADWQELGESNGPSSGNVQVTGSPAALRIGSGGVITGDGVLREVDLSQAVPAAGVTLTFDAWRSASGPPATIALAVSDNGGTDWTNLQTWSFSSLTSTPTLKTFDITAYASANTQIRFLGAGEADAAYFYLDNIQIEYDIPATGGKTAFSTATDTASLVVTPVNDAPLVMAPGSALSATEQVGLAIHGAGFSVTDVDEAGSGARAVVSVGEGILTVAAGDSGVTIDAGNSTASVSLLGTIAQINNLLTGVSTGTITYLNNSDTPSTSTTITVMVNDAGNTGADPGLTGDGASEQGSNSQVINISAVNDEELLATNTGTTVNEASSGNVITTAMLETTDVDNTAPQLTYTVTAATGNGTLRLSGTALGVSDTFTQADIDGGLVTYDHDGSETLSDSFDFSVDDGAGTNSSGTFNFTVTPVNDEEVLATNTGAAVNEASTGNVITTAMLATTDVDNTAAQLTYTVTAATGNGTLRLSGTALSVSDTFTQADIDGGLVTYDHNGSETISDSFDFSVDDGAGTSSSGTFNFTVNPVNDEEVLATNSGTTVNEASTGNVITTAMLETTDVDNTAAQLTYTVTAATGNGTLRLSGTALGVSDTFTQADVDGGLVTYDHDGSETVSDSFDFSVDDGAGTSSSGTFNITVNPVNDNDPTITSDGGGASAAVNVLENDLFVTSVAATDADLPAETLTYSISGGADSAKFSINSSTGVLSFVSAPDFETPTDAGGNNIYDVQVTVSDGNGGTDSQDIAVTVTNVNDAPVNSVPGSQTINQNGMLVFSAATGTSISVGDADAGSNQIQVTLTATNGKLNLLGTKGLTFSTGDGSADTTMTFTGTVADINAALDGATFGATTDFTGAAGVQIVTNDLGNTGPGGTKSDTDNVAITVAVPSHTLWMTFENDEAAIGNPDIANFTGGDVVNYGGTLTFEPGLTSGTFSKNFNLDLIAGSDGDTRVNAVHYVTRDINTGGIDLHRGDLLLSTNSNETIGATTYGTEDVFVFRPTTEGDYSAGSTILLIDGSVLGFGNVTGISLVEQNTVVGGETLRAGDILIANDGKDVLRLEADSLGVTTTGTTAVLVQGADIDFGQNIGALHLIQQDTAIGDTSLQAGQLLLGLVSNDSTVGDAPTINVLRQDVFLLDVTATGAGTTAATAARFFEGLDENLDTNNETVWGISAQYNVAPTASDDSFTLDENSANGTVVGSVSATDPEGDGLSYAILSGNINSAFAINAATGQITVGNSGALDFETNKTFTLTVAAIDADGAYATATVTITLNNLDEAVVNDAPENSVPGSQTIDRDGMVLFSSANGKAISISDFDAGSNPVQVTLTATNGTLNLPQTTGLSFTTGDGTADTTMTFTGTVTDINTALDGMTFAATPGFVGSASVQIVTNDLGNTGTGGPLSDTDLVAIQVEAREQRLWATFENDHDATGNPEIPSITGGDVVVFDDITQVETSNTDPLAATTAGTLGYRFNLDTVAGTDGNTRVDAVHHVKADILVHGVQLRAGDLLFSTDADETINGVKYKSEDITVFRPATEGDYSAGSFFRLVDGADLGLGKVRAVTLVESTTVVGGATLNAGELLIAHDGSAKNIIRFEPTSLGDTTAGTTSILVAGTDAGVGIDQKISGLHLVQADTTFVGVSVQKGQLLVALANDDPAVGGVSPIDVKRQDVFVLDVTATGAGTSAATATRLIEGLDESLDDNDETIWGIALQSNAAPEFEDVTSSVDENSSNGTLVDTLSATDPEGDNVYYAIVGGNTDNAFAVNAVTGQITVNNSAALDFEVYTSFELQIAAIDALGASTTATVTIDVNNLDEVGTNDRPEHVLQDSKTISRNGMVLFSSDISTGVTVSDFDAGGSPVQVTVTVTNGTFNLAGTNGLTFSTGDGTADVTMIFTGTIADINVALEGSSFVATPAFIGNAIFQITTDDLGNTGTGGPLSNTDTMAIRVVSAEQQFWLTFENDEQTTGNVEIPSVTGGDVVTFNNVTQFETSDTVTTAATTSGTFASTFNLDTVLLSDGVTQASSDGNTRVGGVHYVTREMQVGTNSMQLYAGDLLLSLDGGETVGGVNYGKEDVFVFRPDTPGDYSQGSFFLLIDGSDIGLGKVTGIALVEQATVVGGVTLNPGEFLLAHDGAGKDIIRFAPGTLGNTTSGSPSLLVDGSDIDISQNIGGLNLVQADTVFGGKSLSAGQIMLSLQGDDSAVGDTTPINALRQDIFLLDVTATGETTTAATAHRLFEGLDESLDDNNETIWGIGYQGDLAPNINDDTFALDENSINGTVVGSAVGTDPEGGAVYYSITGGNTAGAFAINALTGQITVANSAAVDYETTPVFTLTVNALDHAGTFGTGTITINLNDVNEVPTDIAPNGFSVDENTDTTSGYSLGTLSTTDQDAGDSFTYSIVGGADQAKFSIGGAGSNELILTDGVLNFESQSSYQVTVRTTDSGALTYDETLTITVNDLNEAPVITSDGGGATASVNVAENTTAVTTVTATDEDLPGDTLTYSISGGTDAAKFSINSSTGALTFTIAPDRENPTDANSDAVYEVTVQVSDGTLADSQAISVTVTPVNEHTPTITSDGAGATAAVNVVENTTAVTTVTATDADLPGDTLTYSISGGVDAAKFSINSSTGALTFASAPDFETPTDANSDNVYEVEVQVSDGTLTDTQAISVTVTDVADSNTAPTITSDGGGAAAAINVAENNTAVTTVTATDIDLDTLTYSLSGGADVAKFSINSSTGALTFMSAPDFELPVDVGTDNVYDVIVQVSDGAGGTDSQNIAVTVTAVNEAPVVSVPGAQSTNEDTSLVLSTGNSNLISISDVDAASSPVQLTLSATDGTMTLAQTTGLTFGIGDGTADASMQFTGTVADINSALDGLSFTPTANFTGGAGIGIVVNDQGNSGSGGAQSDTDSVSIIVNAVNDEEVLATNAGTTVNEASTGTVLTTAMLETTDVDNTAAQLTYTITAATGSGTLRLSGTALGVSDTFTQADIDGGLVTYDHDGSETVSDSFDFSVDDGAGTNSSGTFNFTVTAVNDEEVLATNTGTTVNEASTGNVLTTAMLETTDVDNTAAQLTYTVTAATGNGTLRLSGTALDVSDTFTQADIDGGLVTYDHSGSETVSDSFDFSVDDGSGTISSGTFNFTVTPVNDEEVLATNTGTTLNEASSGNVLTTAMLETTDVDNTATQIVYTVTGATGNGTLRLSGTALGVSDTFTQADIDGGLVTYDHDGSETVSDSFDFSVDDGAGTNNSSTFNFTVTPVNDEEVLATNTGTTVNEASSGNVVTTAMLQTTDVDNTAAQLTYTVTAATGNGTLRLSGTSLGVSDTFTQADIDAGLVTYDHNGSETVSDSFDFGVDDGTGTSSSGTFNFTITPVNDEEVLTTNTGVTVNEASTGNVITTAMLETTDADNAAAQLTYTVTTATGNGILRLSGTALGVSDTFTQADIDGGLVTYDHSGSETVSDSFDFNVDDGAGTNSSGTFNFTVTPVNDEEVLATNVGTTVSEASTGNVLTTAMLATTDVDNTAAQLTYTVTTATGNGTLRLSGTALGVSDTFTQADIDAGLVTYDHSGSETVSDSFDFSVDDGAGTNSTGTFNLTVTPVNDEEVLATNTGTTVNEATSGNVVTTAMLQTTDVDNTAAQLTYTVTTATGNGTLRLSGTALGVSDTFTQADIDAGLVTYDHNGSETVSDSFDFSVDDGAGTNSSGTINITVTPVNDEEVLATNTGTTVNEASSGNLITAAMLEATDVDNTAAQLTYTITTATGNGTLRLSGTALGLNETFTQADIDGGLVTYDHNGSETVSDSFDFDVDDGSGTNSSGTFNITVTPVNDEEVLATNTGTTVNEASSGNVITTAMLETTDVDNTAAQLTYTVTTATGNGTLRLSGTALGVSDTFTQADIDGGLVTYDHNGSETVSDSFDFDVDDGAGSNSSGTFNVTLTLVNDEEVLATNTGTTVNEASSGNVITTAMLETTDVDNTAAQLTYTITSATSNGILRLSGTALNMSDTFTQADIDAGLVTYDHNGSETVSDSFDFTVDDGAGTSSSGTFNITATPVNDEEVLATSTGATVNEASTGNVITTGMLETTDVDNTATQLTYTVTAATGNGTLRLSGTALVVSDTFNQADIDAGLVTYDHDGSETVSDSFDFSVDDGAGTSSSGTFNITVMAVNDEEALTTIIGTTVNEASSGNVITTAMLETTDVDNTAAQLTYTVTAATGNGTLRLSGTALGVSDTFTQADIDAGLITYDHNGSETVSDSCDFSVDDGAGTNSSGTFNITITPVNDEEVLSTNAGSTVNEASVGNVITTAMLETTDVDNTAAQLTYTVTTATGNGTLRLLGTALGVSDTFTQADIDTGLVTYDHNGSETVSDSFDFSIDDGTGTSSSGTFNFTITAVNNEEVVATNTGTTVNEASSGNVLTTAMLETTDVDNTAAQLTYTVTTATGNGTLRLNGTALGVSDTFTQADVDAGLVTYDHDGSETVSDSFNFSVNDGAGTSSPGTFNFTITPVNDAPVANADSFTVDNDAALNVSSPGILVNDLDVDGGPLSVTLVTGPTNGTLTLLADGSFTYTTAIGFSGTDSFVYIVSDGIDVSAPTIVSITVNDVFGTTSPGTDPDDTDPTDDSSEDDDDDLPPSVIAADLPTTEEHDAPDPAIRRNPPTHEVLVSFGPIDLATESENELAISSGLFTPRFGREQVTAAYADNPDANSLSLSFVFETGSLFNQLDSMIDDLEKHNLSFELVAGTTIVASGAISVGFVIWAARAGYFLTVLSTSLPAWAMIDPVPVLDAEALAKRTEKRVGHRQDKSLADIVDEQQVSVSVRLLDDRLHELETSLEAVTRDISIDGIGLVCEQPIAAEYIRVQLTTPKGEPMDVLANVRHCSPDGQGYHVGVSIIADWTQTTIESPAV